MVGRMHQSWYYPLEIYKKLKEQIRQIHTPRAHPQIGSTAHNIEIPICAFWDCIGVHMQYLGEPYELEKTQSTGISGK